MEKVIKVKCIDEFTLRNHDETEVLAEVEERDYVAELHEETEEYFAKDDQGREFLVGEININGELVLQDGFKMSSDRVILIKVVDKLGTHTLMSNCFVVQCLKCKKERNLIESDIKENHKILPEKCECGGKNEFKYWLDSVYTEDEYKELERKAELKEQAVVLFRKYPGNININLLKRHLRIGLIASNMLIEALENDGVISHLGENRKRTLLKS